MVIWQIVDEGGFTMWFPDEPAALDWIKDAAAGDDEWDVRTTCVELPASRAEVCDLVNDAIRRAARLW